MLTIFLVRLSIGCTVAVPAADKAEAYGISVAGYPSNSRPLSCGIESRSRKPNESPTQHFMRVKAEAALETSARAVTV